MNKEFVESTIVRLCKRPRTFEFISKNLSGLDPIKVQMALRSLESKSVIKKKDDLYVVDNCVKSLTLDLITPDPQLYLKKYMGYFDFLKTPHPLDFEWRNSTESLNHLVSIILKLNTIDDRILILGMPTLFATACIRDIPQKITLIERNTQILKGLKIINHDPHRYKIVDADIFKVSPKSIGKYSSIIMDPPWYSPFFYQFMWLASNCVEIGGFIAISLPPINTRPSIGLERIEWFSFCQTQGLCLESLHAHQLHYAMPFFEFNAFRSGGISDIHPFWRKGDLAFFKKIEHNKTPRPAYEESIDSWIEREYNSIRIRVNNNNLEERKDDTLTIEHLVKGDILPTVSSRDDRRKKANIWTSGNRIFRTNKPNLFISILDAIIKNNHFDNNDKENKMVYDLLSYIVEIENKEFNEYLDWLYHEMEREPD